VLNPTPGGMDEMESFVFWANGVKIQHVAGSDKGCTGANAVQLFLSPNDVQPGENRFRSFLLNQENETVGDSFDVLFASDVDS